MIRAYLAVLCLGPALCAGCVCSTEAGLLVTVDGIGTSPAPIAALLVEGTALDDDWVDEATFGPPDGESEITLPTTLGIRISGGRSSVAGRIEVCATAKDAGAAGLASGCTTEEAVPGEIVDVLIVLDFGGSDAGLDAGPDGGIDSGPDAGSVCGDGLRQGVEECDGLDLGGEDCVSLGLAGGMLACDVACMFDTSGCSGPPTVPAPRKPINGSYVGNVHVAGSLRPTFVWEPAVAGGGAMILYEIEYSTDPTFFAPTTTTTMTPFENHQPVADMPVSLSAPVGARYYWHVRACAGAVCSPFSDNWYVNVGRDSHDFDGDGYADLAIGAPQADVTTFDEGTVFLFLGSSTGVSTGSADLVLCGAASDDYFGHSVAYSDVNADGFADLIVGARGVDGAAQDTGAAFVFLGSSGPFMPCPPPTATLADAVGFEDFFGWSVANAGDVDGDGYADVLVGAPNLDAGGLDGGAAFLYLGGAGAGFDDTPDATMIGPNDFAAFGTAVSSAGDVNGDGFADVVIGADGENAIGVNAGATYVYFGSPSFDTTPETNLFGTAAFDLFGRGVSEDSDLNSDGFSDLIVGAPGDDTMGCDAGAAFVYFGGLGSALDPTSDGTLLPGATSDSAGTRVHGACDLNGDGFDDVIVSAHLSDAAGIDVGKAVAYFGGSGSTFDTVANGTLIGADPGEWFGYAVSCAGDQNGDGAAEAVVGAWLNDVSGPGAGATYVFDGGTGTILEATPDLTVLGTENGEQLGYAVGR